MIRPKKYRLSDDDWVLLDNMIDSEIVRIIPPKVLPNGEKMAHYDDL